MWQSGVRPPAVVFSPDARQAIATARDARQVLGLWMNQRVVHDTRSVYFPTFTPDSQHLYWATEDTNVLHIYLDGQPVISVDRGFFNGLPQIWSVDRQGTLTFVGSDGSAVKRYRVRPGADASVASLLANGTTNAKRPEPSSPPAPKTTPPPAAAASVASAPVSPAQAAAATAARVATAPSAPAAIATTPAPPLTLNDLYRRPELLPATAAISRELRFQDGVSLRAGTVATVLELKPGNLVLETNDGQTQFATRPEETDVLARANADWAKLTAAQRDLTYPDLLRRPELWPYRVKLTVPFEFTGGSSKVGDTALLLGLEGQQFLVRLERSNVLINVDPKQTDFMAQARALVLNEGATAPGRLLEEFSPALASTINGRKMPLDLATSSKYVILYRGAGWCGPCLQFSPHLVKLLQEKNATGAVPFVYVSADENPAQAKTYLTKLGVDWPTIYYRSRDQLPAFNTLFGESIPQLIVTDRHGKVLVDSARVGHERALAQLRQLL